MEMQHETEALAASFDLVSRQDEAEKAITVLRSDVDEVKARLDRVSRAAARPQLTGTVETARTDTEVKSFVDGYLRRGRETELKSIQGTVPADGGYAVPREIDAMIAELDPALAPGEVVRIPEQSGNWRVESWEWRERGVELELRRLPRGAARQTPADPGDALPAPDRVATATELLAFELPWDGVGAGTQRQVYAAVSSASRGWTGAALYADQAGNLVPLGTSGTQRSVIGRAVSGLAPSAAVLFDKQATLEIEVVSDDFELASATAETLAAGGNRALLGSEVIQFAEAIPLGGALWKLRGLLRGRGGTEAAAQAGHAPGTPFVLLDGQPLAIDPAKLDPTGATSLAAIGLADSEPVLASIANPGRTLCPLTPVHPRAQAGAAGSLILRWTRRARGAWTWPDGIEVPLNEQAEAYLVGLGDVDQPALRWELSEPKLELPATTLAQLASEHTGQPLWVRQVGSFAASPPLLLTVLG